MLELVRQEVPDPKEIIVVSSGSASPPFPLQSNEFWFGNSPGSALARNKGAAVSHGDVLLFADAHTCFTQDDIEKLLDVLARFPDAIVAPGIQPIEFPACTPSGSTGFGVFFDLHFGWHWLGKESEEEIVKVPFASACFLMMSKATFNDSLIGFIPVEGVGFEEEICMRLAHLGHPTLVVPDSTLAVSDSSFTSKLIVSDVTVGHQFKQRYPPDSPKGYIPSRAASLVLSVFDEDLFAELDTANSEQWGSAWASELGTAWAKFAYLRTILKHREVDSLNERWYFRK